MVRGFANRDIGISGGFRRFEILEAVSDACQRPRPQRFPANIELAGVPETRVILHGVVDAKTHASFHHGAYVHEAVQPPLLQEGDEDPDGARDAATAEAHFSSGKF